MRIFLDMDDVLVPMCQTLFDIYNEETNSNFKMEQKTTWEFDDHMIKGKAYEILERKGFFRNLIPYDGVVENIKDLMKDYEVFIITNPSGNEQIKQEKYEWIAEYLPFFPKENIIMTSDKSQYGKIGDILVDDAPHYLTSWKGTTIRMVRPWNRYGQGHFDVENNDFAKVNRLIREIDHLKKLIGGGK